MKRILIADDSQEMRTMYELVFSSLEFQLYLVQSGREAMELLNERKVDLIISDLEMPDGNGYWLLEKLKTADLSIKTIIISGDTTAEERSLKERGAFAFFPKPLHMDSFLQLIFSVI